MINLDFLSDLQHLVNSAKVEKRNASSVNLDFVFIIFLGKGSKKKKNSLEFSIRVGGFLPILGPFPYFFFLFLNMV